MAQEGHGMTRRILLINPIGTDIMDDLTVEVVSPALMPDTAVVCRSLGGPGVPPSPFLAPAATYTNQLLAMVAGAAEEGFDAVAVCCAGDPALSLAKSVASVPVVGANEAACRTASALGGRVTFLQRRLPESFVARMPTQRNDHWLRALAASYGLAPHDIDVKPVPVPDHPSHAATMALAERDPEKLRTVVLEAMRTAALTGGVEAIDAAVERGDHGAGRARPCEAAQRGAGGDAHRGAHRRRRGARGRRCRGILDGLLQLHVLGWLPAAGC